MKLSIVISVFGNKVDIFLSPLLKSIKKVYKDIDILVIGKDIPLKDNNLIKNLREKYAFARTSPGSLKQIAWLQGFKLAKSEWVLFLDADTLLLKPIDHYLDLCKKNKVDWMFTWRPSLPYWHNNGVQLLRKNNKTLDFYESYLKRVIENVKISRTSQYSFQELISLSESEISNIVNCQNKEKIFEFNKSGIKFAGVSCYYMNNTFSTENLNNDVRIIHYKGILGTILMKDNKEDRYSDFLKYNIFDYKDDHLINIHKKIELWKNFSTLKDTKDIINILSHYEKIKKDSKGISKLKRKAKYFIIRKFRSFKGYFF